MIAWPSSKGAIKIVPRQRRYLREEQARRWNVLVEQCPNTRLIINAISFSHG